MKRKIITDANAPLAQENPPEFSDLLAQYKAAVPASGGTGSGFNWMGIAAATGAVLIGLAVFFNSGETSTVTSDSESDSQTTAAHGENDPASESTTFKLPSWTKVISTKTASTLVSPAGVILEIPAHAFSSSSGETPDSVTISLTQYDDVASIIHSQIPMYYDSAGVDYHFQTDGMFKLDAKTHGETLQLNTNISVHYPQTSGEEGMNTYAFTNGRWNYEGASPLTTYKDVCENTVYRFTNTSGDSEFSEEKERIHQELDALSAQTASLKHDLHALEGQKPLKPIAQDLNNYRFTLDVSPEEFPELSHFKDVIFEVKDSRFTHSIYAETWNDVTVNKSPREGRYLITLKNTQRVEIFDVYPVLTDQDYEEALAEYSKKLTEIELAKSNKNSRIRKNKEREEAFMAQLKTYERTAFTLPENVKVINDLTSELAPSSPYRSITIGSLGIVNFDKPLTILKKGVAVMAAFVIKSTKIPVNAVSVIDVKNRAFYTYRKEDFHEFRVQKGREYLIVSSLEDGRVAAYKNTYSTDQVSRGERHLFQLELAPDYTTLDELKEFLGLSEVDA